MVNFLTIERREISKLIAEINGRVFMGFYDDARYPQHAERVWIKATLYCPTDGEYEGQEWYSPFNDSFIYSQIKKHGLCVDARKEITVVKFEHESEMMTIKNKEQDVAILLAVIAKNA